jgi:hypothetical protein
MERVPLESSPPLTLPDLRSAIAGRRTPFVYRHATLRTAIAAPGRELADDRLRRR